MGFGSGHAALTSIGEDELAADFFSAAKLILLVDVRGEDDFRAKSSLVMTVS